MRILGIDCGTERTGWGVIESDGRVHRLIGAGTIRTSPRDSLPVRLLAIASGIREVIATHRPGSAAVEEVFHAVNAKSALKLAHVRGAAFLVLAESSLAAGEYSPLLIKQTVVGHGHAGKQQVQFMMRSLLGPDVPVKEADACDALAVAVCHAAYTARAVA